MASRKLGRYARAGQRDGGRLNRLGVQRVYPVVQRLSRDDIDGAIRYSGDAELPLSWL